jgi:hypothetical protein
MIPRTATIPVAMTLLPTGSCHIFFNQCKELLCSRGESESRLKSSSPAFEGLARGR